jgi:hypothetical protein
MGKNLHYVACWTETDGIHSCGHEHLNMEDAMGYLVPDGRTFIRARDYGELRSLNDREAELFRELLKRSQREKPD